MSGQVVVQMHGDPGSGKSVLARAIGRALPAVVIDKDAISSPLLATGVDAPAAGAAAYEIMRELAADFLADGYSVIFDSPCAWPAIEERGRALAARAGASWAMIETNCPSPIIDARLVQRTARLSQPKARQAWYDRPGTYRPSCERLVLDSTRPVEQLAAEAVRYLRSIRVSSAEPRLHASVAEDGRAGLS